jgi:hypothetical protein
MDETKWEIVFTASGMILAKIVAGRLEAEGIATRFRYDVAGSIYGITVDGLGAVKIEVPEEEAERARAILRQSYEDCLPDGQNEGG